MAGIGFELRKLLKDGSFFGMLRAYGFAGLISSGPWVFSIVGVMLIGVFSIGVIVPAVRIVQFLVSVTYLMMASLILTGALQLLFSRFVADRLFEGKEEAVLPNLIGALTLTSIAATVVGAPLLAFTFTKETSLYRVLMLASFVLLCDLWIVVVLLSGLKAYRAILGIFFGGYALSVATSMGLRRFGISGLLGGFLFGQAVMFFSMLALVVRGYPSDKLVAYDFLRPSKVYYSLAFTGLFYNLGIWADKLIFWGDPLTSEPVIGPLRSSIIYDLPIFLAYLSIVPGMSIFMVRVETDFAEQYDAFYNAVREGDTLTHIEHFKDRMVYAVRQGVYEIFKVQGMTVVVLLLLGPTLLRWIGISPLYLGLLNVDLVGVGVQVLLLAILNVFFYLDQRGIALGLSFLFFAANAILTLGTLKLGAAFYGYGFAISVALTSFVGLGILSRKLERLEYETFMIYN
jgi:uncharacterized membrane protein